MINPAPLKEIQLTDYVVENGTSKLGQAFFRIVNNNNDYYFCFKETVKEGWGLLDRSLKKELTVQYKEKEFNGRVYRQVVTLVDGIII